MTTNRYAGWNRDWLHVARSNQVVINSLKEFPEGDDKELLKAYGEILADYTRSLDPSLPEEKRVPKTSPADAEAMHEKLRARYAELAGSFFDTNPHDTPKLYEMYGHLQHSGQLLSEFKIFLANGGKWPD